MRLTGFALLAASAATVAGMAGAQQPARSVQQDFDAATALSAGKDQAAALAAWQALEARVHSNVRTRAIVLVRKSAVLLALDRRDEASAAARAGLAALPTKDPTLIADRFAAQFNLGRIAQSALDYASAAAAYREAEQITDDAGERLAAQIGEVDTMTFVDPVAALAAAQRMDAAASTTKLADDSRARVAQAHAMLLLNTGDFAAARDLAQKAVNERGGLTMKVKIADVEARSTAALAALLSGHPDDARRYMAYTGAGRLPQGSFDPAVQMRVPECGGDANLKPDDAAVIEFSIGEDGTVIASSPIYAAGGGAAALEFARAARDWSWTPDQVKALPNFFRYAARVEMRCSTAFERPSIAQLLDARLDDWLGEHGVEVPAKSDSGDAGAVGRERAALAAADARDPGSLATLLALHRLAENVVVPRDETNQLAQRALGIAKARNAPLPARLAIELQVAGSEGADTWRTNRYRHRLEALLAVPDYAGDPVSRSALRLMLADADKNGADRRARLREVADDPSLPKSDAMRVGALVRLASLEEQSGNAEAAKVAFDQSGLTPDQCAIVDAPPRMLSVGGTFPQEAMTWGFEGWTQTQFDISADGKVVHQRAILSYPPFVFTKAGIETSAGAKYAKTYRPGGEMGCNATTQRVRFVLPH